MSQKEEISNAKHDLDESVKNEEKNFQCEICEISFTQSNHLKGYIESIDS